ncbi:septal ring factor EnvC (AmiA/AmiB activator) [Clostridium pascui]|uniref:hypothetical protein n=1 Tax=Clostridium pascui TaxID=46609 RepID=UPI0019570380|nr:hypothetical protein [Clostridium pascui]MBM7871033.1 septal ring factor EnvC (AmiA/AmiB activator) [Clostridium pascui]
MKKRLYIIIDVIYNSFQKAQYLIRKSLMQIGNKINTFRNKSELINASYNSLIAEKQAMEKSLLSELNSLKETDNKLILQIKEYKFKNENLKKDIEVLQEMFFSK